MVTDLRKAAEQALEALHYMTIGTIGGGNDQVKASITALREALAKPVVQHTDSCGVFDERNQCTCVTAKPDVPEGWKLVPVEPTPDMVSAAGATPGMRAIDAASALTQIRCGRALPDDAFAGGAPLVQAYRAMLAAAPQPKDKP